jgi:HEAT repeat protein
MATLGPTDDAGTEDALLQSLAAPDAGIRLHAALALARAGGARAREELLACLDGGDEVDRAAVLSALGGILSRVPTDRAIKRLTAALELAAGPERDSLVDALGQPPSPAGEAATMALAASTEPSDRREVAAVLAAHPGDGAARVTRLLLADADVGVRAQAAWTLGTVGNAADEASLVALAHGPDLDMATNATAALGRIAARLQATDLAARALCPLIRAADEQRASVRANALAGLWLGGARCGDGSAERRALAEDSSDDVRVAAARTLTRSPSAEDARALATCAHNDPSGAVAARCREAPAVPAARHPLLVYVVAEGTTTPRPGSSFALLMSDGLLHEGTTDRRGAVFDPAAPEGVVTLRGPTALH